MQDEIMYTPSVLFVCQRAVLNPALRCTQVAQWELRIWGQGLTDKEELNIATQAAEFIVQIFSLPTNTQPFPNASCRETKWKKGLFYHLS